MNNAFQKWVSLFYLLFVFYPNIAQTPSTDKNWNTDTTTMTFYDGFNGTTLNSSKWTVGLQWGDSAAFAYSITGISYLSNTVTITTGTNGWSGTSNSGLAVGNVVQLKNISGITSTPAINNSTFTVTAVSSSSPWTFSFGVSSYTGSYSNSPHGYEVSTDNYSSGLGTKNVSVSGGNCILKETYNTAWPMDIHLGLITTYPNTYKFGYYEIHCKQNSEGTRFDRAFWNWRGAGSCGSGSPWYNEIDFFETIQNNNPPPPLDFDVTSNLHSQTASYCGWNHDNNGNILYSDYYPPTTDSSLFSQFHTYGYEWSPGRVVSYLDGVQYRWLNSPYVSDSALWLVANLGLQNWFFQAPSGGELGVSPYNANYMTIDYIKIYNMKLSGTGGCSGLTNNTTNNFNPTTFIYELYNNITITGTSTGFTSGSNNTIRAANGVNISGTFNVPAGSTFLILPTQCQ